MPQSQNQNHNHNHNHNHVLLPSNVVRPPKLVVLADLNVDPPEVDEDDSPHFPPPPITTLVNEKTEQKSILPKDTDSADGEGKKLHKLGKCRSRFSKTDSSVDGGADGDGDQHGQGVASSREEKVSSLKTVIFEGKDGVLLCQNMPKSLGQSVNLFTAEKWLLPESVKDSGKVDLSVKLFEDTLLVPLFTHTGGGDRPLCKLSSSQGLVHVARKMPKNAHAHFILGLMYQRLGQPQKALPAYVKAAEILLQSEAEISRPELLSLVQIHQAQCLILESAVENSSDKELEPQELDEIISKLKESVQSDIRQAAVWNTLGFVLLKTGRLQSAITVLSSLLAIAPDNYDCLGNLGISYLQSGNLELSAKCFQELILKDQNHPAALINYAALLLCKYASVIAGAGASASEGASADQVAAVNVAKECLLAAVKADPKSGHIWTNLANAFSLCGDHKSSSKCLEKAARLDPNCMSTRYAVAIHRIKDAERSLDREQLSWAGNEMASIIRDGDSSLVELHVAWSGLAMVHKAQHEIAAAFETEQHDLMEVEERAVCVLKQAIAEDPDDAVHWHQLGLHGLCTRQFKTCQKYLKAAVARDKNSCYAWSNLGVSLQLSEEPSKAEEVYKQALALATTQQAHAILSNLGNLYRQQKQYQRAKAMFTKSLELQPGYAPAYNNLGLVFIAEGLWEEAKHCFDKAFQSDPLLDAAKSNEIKAVTMSKLCRGITSCTLQE